MYLKTIESRFVKNVPRQLEAGILYISMEYGTAVHSCCCGCGQEVVTPLSASGWKLLFDGTSVSLRPSIGNWNFPCRSHYFINCNRVIDAGPRRRNQTNLNQHNHAISEKSQNCGIAVKNNIAATDFKNGENPNEILPLVANHSKLGWLKTFFHWISR